jgi:hypothetical protein
MRISTTRRPLIVLTLLLVAAAPAAAAPGVRISWDHCSADGRIANKNFACNTNSGIETLVISFESPVARTDRTGIEISVPIFAAEPAVLPAWWQFRLPGTCRLTAVSSSLVPADPSACANPWPETAASGTAYRLADWGPSSAQLLIAAAVPAPDSFSVVAGVEYFAVRVNINHTKSVGAGACAGCMDPVCIGIGYVKIVSPLFGDDILLAAGTDNPGGGDVAVTWQGAHVNQFFDRGGAIVRFVSMTCVPAGATATRRETWGRLRSLYR